MKIPLISSKAIIRSTEYALESIQIHLNQYATNRWRCHPSQIVNID